VFTRVSPVTSALLVCDMQEKFRSMIQFFPEIVTVSRRLLDAAKILDMKVVATEQYPQGLGHTVPELGLDSYKVPIFDKTKFSMCLPPVLEKLGPSVTNVILVGIEAHVCIYQTALDLLEKGITVHVVADAVSSRSLVDRHFAFKQLDRAGAVLTTSECVILGLLGGSSHPKFREVQKLILHSAPDTGLLQSQI